MPIPTSIAVAAQLARIATGTEQIATGEPCRCPEAQLDCSCGAYQNVEVR